MQNEKELESEKLKCEIEKLKAETENVKKRQWENRVAKYIPLVTVFIAIGSFWWGIYSFEKTQRAEIEKLKTDFSYKIELASKESRNRFYEKQLEIYLDLTKTAAQISVEKNNDKINKLHEHFLELLNGNLVIVRDGTVREAARNFENILKKPKKEQEDLGKSAENLADACRTSLGSKWSIPMITKNEK